MQSTFGDIALSHIEVLLNVVDLGNFTLAAHAAGISPAAVSKIVSRLEKRLGIHIFVRTTRHMRLTDSGQKYVDSARQALALLREAELHATGAQTVPTGNIRLSLPTPYANWRVLPVLAEFREKFPGISINVHISNHTVNLTGDPFDIAIRGSELADSDMIARKLEDAELVIFASPAYMRGAAALKTPGDLEHHECIQFVLPRSGKNSNWIYMENRVMKEVATTGAITCEEEYLGGLALAQSGAGIYQTYRFAIDEDLKAGRLVELLPEYGGATRPFYLVYPRSSVQTARLRAFIDFLADKLTTPFR